MVNRRQFLPGKRRRINHGKRCFHWVFLAHRDWHGPRRSASEAASVSANASGPSTRRPPLRRTPGAGAPGPGDGQVPHQGHRRVRRRAREHARGLRHRRWPERHGRRSAERPVHQAEPGGHAGAPGGQHPRRPAEHQERGGGDGDRQAAALRRPRLADRRQRLGPGRRQEPAGPAAGRGRPRLCGGARHRANRGDQRHGSLGLVGVQRSAHGRAHRRRRDGGGRERLPARPHGPDAADPAPSRARRWPRTPPS